MNITLKTLESQINARPVISCYQAKLNQTSVVTNLSITRTKIRLTVFYSLACVITRLSLAPKCSDEHIERLHLQPML